MNMSNQVLVWVTNIEGDDHFGSTTYEADTPEKLEAAAREIVTNLYSKNAFGKPLPTGVDDRLKNLYSFGSDRIAKSGWRKNAIFNQVAGKVDDLMGSHEDKNGLRDKVARLIAGEQVIETVATKESQNDEDWAKVIADNFKKFPDATLNAASDAVTVELTFWKFMNVDTKKSGEGHFHKGFFILTPRVGLR